MWLVIDCDNETDRPDFSFRPEPRLIIYLRDDKPEIPFPNHWDFFGGHLEADETPEQALVREVREEIGLELATLAIFSPLRVFDR